jgi:aminopeptidase Y
MLSSKSVNISGSDEPFNKPRSSKLWTLVASVGLILIIVIFILSIVTLAKVNQSNRTESPINNSTTVPMNPTFVTSIRVADAMSHLQELQRIATGSSGTRAINTPGFNQTLDYIITQLTDNTNYVISRSYFPVRDFKLVSDPILISSIGGVIKNYTYSTDLSTAEFYYVKYSTSANFSDFVELTAIPNVACTDDDWMKANPPPQDRVALVKRGTCPFRDKVILATKYNVAAVLLYNDGGSSEHIPPIAVSLAQNNTLPALFLSYTIGQELVDASQNPSNNVSVQLVIDAENLPDFPVGNICADTPTGDITQTIVIGSHSDSVPAGPGINDNGKISV